MDEQAVVTEPEPPRELPRSLRSPQGPRSGRWRRRAVRLAIVLCVSWLVFVVLHRILSARTYLWGPFDLLPPLTFAVVPVVLLVVAQLARPVRWRLTLAPALALLLGVGYSGINFSTLWYAPPPAPADAITMVAMNTQYWDQDLANGQPRTTADFYRFLRGLNADVYMLNEYAHLDMTRPDVFSQALSIDQAALMREAFPGYTLVIEGRNVTITRLPVVGHQALDTIPWLPKDLRPVPPGLRDRPLFYTSQTLRTDIQVNGQTVSFYNSHIFQPPQRIFRLSGDPGQSMFEIDRFNFEIRQASYRAIQADMTQNRNRIVMAGDLNTTPSMNLIDMVPDRLVDHTRVLSTVYPVTWEMGSSTRLWRLDWLFTTPDVAVHDYDFLNPDGLSDHKAQRALLSVI